MAITTYKRNCGYKVGSLKPIIYFLPKDEVKINFSAKNRTVSVSSIVTKNKTAKIEALSVTYNQNTSYNDRFSFENSLEIVLDEQLNDSFLEGLKNLRENEYYIVVENRENAQFLINCELYTTLSYEYNFTDDEDSENNCVITFTNLSNYPLLILENNIKANIVWISSECSYIKGKVIKMLLADYDELYSSNNGIMVGEIFLNSGSLYDIDYLPMTLSLTESYDGKEFTETLTFSIPLDDYKHYWHYNLIEFQKNKYKAMVFTNNGNMILVGDQYGLFPSYEIETSEEYDTLDTITITMRSVSQYGSLSSIWSSDGQSPDNVFYLYRNFVTDECGCNGYDWCEILKKQVSTNYGATWADVFPLQLSYGSIVEPRSEKCDYGDAQRRWVQSDETVCVDSKGNVIDPSTGEIIIPIDPDNPNPPIGDETEEFRFISGDGYLCNGTSKFEKKLYQKLVNGVWVTQYETYGSLIEQNSTDCNYSGDNPGGYTYYRTIPSISGDYVCVGYDKYSALLYQGSNDNLNWVTIRKIIGNLIEENSVDCGYTLYRWNCSDEILYKGDGSSSELSYRWNCSNNILYQEIDNNFKPEEFEEKYSD